MLIYIAVIIIQMVCQSTYTTKNLNWQHIVCYLYQDCLIPIQINHTVYHGQIFGKDAKNDECKFKQSLIESTNLLSIQSNINSLESIGINQKYYWYLQGSQTLSLTMFNKLFTRNIIKLGKLNYQYHQIISIMTRRFDKILVFTGNQYWISNLKDAVYQDRKLQSTKQLISHAMIDDFIIFIYRNEIELFKFSSGLEFLHSLVFTQHKFIDIEVEKQNDIEIVYILSQQGYILIFLIQNNKLTYYDKKFLNISSPKKIDVIGNYVYVVDSIKDLYDYAIKFRYSSVSNDIKIERYYMKNQLINDVIGLDSSFSVLVGDFFHRIIKTDLNNLTIKNNLNVDLYVERQIFDIKIQKIDDSKFQIVGYNQTQFFVDEYTILKAKLFCKSDKQLVLNYDVQLLASSCDEIINSGDCKISKSIMITYMKQKSKWERALIIFIEIVIFLSLFAILLLVFYFKIKEKKQRIDYFQQKIEKLNFVECVEIVESDISPKEKKYILQQGAILEHKKDLSRPAFGTSDQMLSSITTPAENNQINLNI